jgi:hypothetical protein
MQIFSGIWHSIINPLLDGTGITGLEDIVPVIFTHGISTRKPENTFGLQIPAGCWLTGKNSYAFPDI